jgi:predicted DNA-binding transcriptional regulator AlpA
MRGSKSVPQKERPVRGELLTAVQVGERLNLSEKTIYNWKKSGELPIDYFYINGNLRFDSADVEDYILLSRFKSQKAQLDPYHIEEWLERTEQQIADMKEFLRKHTRAGKLAEV